MIFNSFFFLEILTFGAIIVIGVCGVIGLGAALGIKALIDSFNKPTQAQQQQQTQFQRQKAKQRTVEQKLGHRTDLQVSDALIQEHLNFQEHVNSHSGGAFEQRYDRVVRPFEQRDKGLQDPRQASIEQLMPEHGSREGIKEAYRDACNSNDIFVSQYAVDNHDAISQEAELRNELYIHPHVIAVEQARRAFEGSYQEMSNNINTRVPLGSNRAQRGYITRFLSSYNRMIRVLDQNKQQLQKSIRNRGLVQGTDAYNKVVAQIRKCEAEIQGLKANPIYQAVQKKNNTSVTHSDQKLLEHINAGLQQARSQQGQFVRTLFTDRLTEQIGIQRQNAYARQQGGHIAPAYGQGTRPAQDPNLAFMRETASTVRRGTETRMSSAVTPARQTQIPRGEAPSYDQLMSKVSAQGAGQTPQSDSRGLPPAFTPDSPSKVPGVAPKREAPSYNELMSKLSAQGAGGRLGPPPSYEEVRRQEAAASKASRERIVNKHANSGEGNSVSRKSRGRGIG